MFLRSFSENESDRPRLSGRLIEDDSLVTTSLRNPWDMGIQVSLDFIKARGPPGFRHQFQNSARSQPRRRFLERVLVQASERQCVFRSRGKNRARFYCNRSKVKSGVIPSKARESPTVVDHARQLVYSKLRLRDPHAESIRGSG